MSAVAVEEKSVIDYNTGNPDGILQEGEEPRPPRVPLVAIYPKEGTLYSDNPLFVLDAEWVDRRRGRGRPEVRRLRAGAGEPAARCSSSASGPATPTWPSDAPIDSDNGVDPDQPQTLLEVPAPAVLVRLLDDWQDQRKPARVLLLIDVSGSMGDLADPDTGATKLDLAKPPPSTPSTSSTTTTRWGCASSRPTSARRCRHA